MNTTAPLPSHAGTTLITWVATFSIVWVLASVLGLAAGHVTTASVLGLVAGLPVAIKATRASNRRKAILRRAAARTTPTQYQAPAAH